MNIVPRRLQHSSGGTNRPSDVAVTVNFNAEINLMAVNPIIECISRDLVTEECQGLESSRVYTVSPFFVESFHGRSNRSLPRLVLHMPPDEMFPTFITTNIYIRQCHPKTLTLTLLHSANMFEVILIAGINTIVGLQGIRNFRALRNVIPY
jgi:hypothetical protein